MSARVVLSAYNVAGFAGGGGHCSVYLQYVHGLRAQGCEVWWLERLSATDHQAPSRDQLSWLATILASAGLEDRIIFYTGATDAERRYVGIDRAAAERVFADCDLLLNFHYGMDPELLVRFPRTALVDIDPGLLQIWMSRGHLAVGEHDVYFTTGEGVGGSQARFPDAGIDWRHIRPPISLDHWPVSEDPPRPVFTTISNWWGEEWMCDAEGRWYDNNKRASFLVYSRLPARAPAPLELALSTGPSDAEDVDLLRRRGWRVRSSREVSATPESYRDYIRSSRGEFSCSKPSAVRLNSVWISDRTVCYLASGRPAVVQHTGHSSSLPDDDGLLRFRSPDEAVARMEQAVSAYQRHCRSARALAEEFFDARKIALAILGHALAPPSGNLGLATPRPPALRTGGTANRSSRSPVEEV